MISCLIFDRKLRRNVRTLLLKGYIPQSPQHAANLLSVDGTSNGAGGFELVETATGKYYLPADAWLGDTIATAIRNNDIHEAPVYECAKRFISPNSTVLDVGSNFGQMAIMFSRHVGKQGVVHAFEANSYVFDILQKNISVNNAPVVPHYGAVHNISGETLFFPETDNTKIHTLGWFIGRYYAHAPGGGGIPSIAIDDVEYHSPVSFIKTDIQGGDLFALQGARKTIDKYRMPILFEYEYCFEPAPHLGFQKYVDFVKEIGYVFTRVIMGQNYLILPREAPKSLVAKALEL